jgi:hypothetical protein
MSQNYLNIFIALISVSLGFFLSEASFYIKKRRENRRLINVFSSELNSIKSSLREQINSNNEFIDGLNDYRFNNPRVTIGSNLDFIQALDRLIIIDHFTKRVYYDDGKKIRSVYNQLNVIQSEMKRFDKFLDEFNSVARESYESYNKSVDKIMRFIADILPRNEEEIKQMDTKVKDLISFLDQKILKRGNIVDIISNKSEVHIPLFEMCYHLESIPTFNSKLLTELNQDSFDILKKYVIKMDGFKNKMIVINESLERSFDRIFI